MKKAFNRMTNKQVLLVIEWIKQGRSQVEVNELSAQQNPPFFVNARKYQRYYASYSPAYASQVIAQVEQERAWLEALWPSAEEERKARPKPAQPVGHKAPAEAPRTISDYIREMLAEQPRKRPTLRDVRDTFS